MDNDLNLIEKAFSDLENHKVSQTLQKSFCKFYPM